MSPWLLLFSPSLLLVALVVRRKRGRPLASVALASLGLLAAAAGDWFLAVKAAPLHSIMFVWGVLCFSCAQVCWISHLMIRTRLDVSVLSALSLCLGLVLWERVLPVSVGTWHDTAIVVYALLSVLSVSFAAGMARQFKRGWLWFAGLGSLLVSDLCIALGQIAGQRVLVPLIGPTYVAALLFVAAAVALCGHDEREPIPIERKRAAAPLVVWGVSLAAVVCFAVGAVIYPGGYNPFMRMLSSLGRTEVNGTVNPVCAVWFGIGMLLAAIGVVWFTPVIAGAFRQRKVRHAVAAGGAVNGTGLLIILLIPENVNGVFHNLGCVLAAGGAAVMFAVASFAHTALVPRIPRRVIFVALILVLAVFEGFIEAHHFKLLPFSPYVPTMQKALIIGFIAYLCWLSLWIRRRASPAFPARR